MSVYADLARNAPASVRSFSYIVICNGCGGKIAPGDLTVDHIHPRSRRGTDDPQNLWDMCRSCNSSKNNRTMCEWLTVAKLKVVEYWRDRTPPIGVWSKDPEYRGTRRLIPIRWLKNDNRLRDDYFFRLVNGRSAVAYQANPNEEFILVDFLNSKGDKEKVKRTSVIEMTRLRDVFDYTKRPKFKNEILFKRADRVVISSGRYEGKIGVVQFIDKTGQIHVNFRNPVERVCVFYKDLQRFNKIKRPADSFNEHASKLWFRNLVDNYVDP